MKSIFKWINIFISIGVFFIALGTAYVAIPYFGNQALIVRSGSMAPTIDAGSIVVIRPEIELVSPQANKIPIYNKNDIIAFRSPASPDERASRGRANNPNTIVTHRVVGVKADKNGVVYKTKGDANDDVDSWLVDEKNVLGYAYFTLPLFGHVLAFARSDLGFPLLIIMPAIVVILLELYNIIKTIREGRNVKKIKIVAEIRSHLKHPLHLSGLKIFVPLLMIGLAIPVAFAFPSDTETSTNNIFSAAEDFFADSSTTPTPTPTPAAFGIADHVVISEVQITGGPGKTNNDFVELYNPTSNDINLDDFRLVKRTKAATSSASLKVFTSLDIIPAHGFYLWANSDGGFALQINADAATTANLTNDNSVALLNPTGSIVDATAWGSGHAAPLIEGSAFSTNPPDNQSMERKALSTSDADSMTSGSDVSKGNGFDLDDNSTDFLLRALSQPQNSSSGTEMP